VGWRGAGWGALLGACLVGGAVGHVEAVELRRLDVLPSPGGATARLVLSAPVRAAVHGVTITPGTVSRLYVDLPPGTRLGREIARLSNAPAPLAALRIGVGEAGVLRVVLELDGAATYRVRRGERGRVLTVALAPEATAPATEPPPGPSVAERLARPKIVLDPGHGGHDPGAGGFAVEKEVTLAIARHLAGLLRTRLGADVVLTRTGDATLPLAARTARANAESADLFLSIHANASRSPRLRGIETYYLNNTHDRATIRLAAMENGLRLPAPARRGSDLRYIVSDLVQVGKMEESIGLATAVQQALIAHLGARYPGIVDLGVKRGPFYVLVGAYMPCVLVETSFLTHPAEGRRLAARAYRETVAEGVYAGVARFLADARRARTL
jgi:N-acetylmuramoyl-L-alanine amidase